MENRFVLRVMVLQENISGPGQRRLHLCRQKWRVCIFEFLTAFGQCPCYVPTLNRTALG